MSHHDHVTILVARMVRQVMEEENMSKNHQVGIRSVRCKSASRSPFTGG